MKTEVNYNSLKKVCDKKIIRKFDDMEDRFKDTRGVKGNPTIYKVYIRYLEKFEVGLTVIEPGTINREYYMTKGHKHKKSFPEFYILEKGRGKLILQDKKSKIVNLKKNQPVIVPGRMAHRLVNIGSQKLEVVAIYNKKSGHDYSVKFKKRLLKK